MCHTQGTTQYEVYRWRVIKAGLSLHDSAHPPTATQDTAASSENTDTTIGPKDEDKQQGLDKSAQGPGSAGTEPRSTKKGRSKEQNVPGASAKQAETDSERVGQGSSAKKAGIANMRHPFDKGVWRNFNEVMFPRYHLGRHALTDTKKKR